MNRARPSLAASTRMNLESRLEKHRTRLDKHLARLLPPEDAEPRALHQAMRYSVLGGGKRIRPILCLETTAALTDRTAGVEDLACAIEFIHTYSLIHDDLPALDNDDLRRGQPTCHKRFGEAIAILAGDALLTLAFEILGRMPQPEPYRRTQILRELAAAAGTRGGMIGGQVADLDAVGKKVSPEQLKAIHGSKTGALIRAAVRSGGLFAGARGRTFEHLSVYGEKIGLAFQIVDDVLDVRSSPDRLGKPAGKDAARHKATYPAVHGLEASERMAAELVEAACAELEFLGPRGGILEALACHLLERTA
ncbi:MAG: polyprenyl synthetase family protein [Acidobacteria bacterium]|nr:polyprenyl synthetase family protein [Acidobacteriota bacterium]